MLRTSSRTAFRYSARDVAVMRAARGKIPIVLGSATPALESLYNVRQGNYRLLELPERTGEAGFPSVQLLDMRRLKAHDSLSPPLVEQLQARLQRGEQSLLFLNRRGFAPAWMCHGCGWTAACKRCDARLTYHQRRGQLLCHHCGAEQPLIKTCPACGVGELKAIGAEHRARGAGAHAIVSDRAYRAHRPRQHAPQGALGGENPARARGRGRYPRRHADALQGP